jgi:hypothetical protein
MRTQAFRLVSTAFCSSVQCIGNDLVVYPPPCGVTSKKPNSERIPFQRTGVMMIKPASLIQAWAVNEAFFAEFIAGAVAPTNCLEAFWSQPLRSEQVHIPGIDQTSRLVRSSPWTM